MTSTSNQFRKAFNEVAERERSKLRETWESNEAFTESMLNKGNGAIVEVAKTLGIKCCPSYWGIDAIFYREHDEAHFPPHHIYAKRISAAIEHENNPRTSNEEMNKLCQWNVPLAVLITYPLNVSPAEMLKDYSAIAREADFFQDFAKTRRKMVIFGSRKGNDISWDFFEFDGNTFLGMVP